jgi:hypothetical protein
MRPGVLIGALGRTHRAEYRGRLESSLVATSCDHPDALRMALEGLAGQPCHQHVCVGVPADVARRPARLRRLD